MHALHRLLRGAMAGATALALLTLPAAAEKFSLKIASGHGPNWHFVQLTQEYFIPEVKKRVKERTGHEIEFVEGWAGAMVKATEVLEGLQSGIIDVGIYCACHEGQKLPLSIFGASLPFGPSDPDIAVKATRKVYDTVAEVRDPYEKKYGQRVLALVPLETYKLLANYPIRSAADVKGRKIGAAGPNSFWVEGPGALPVQVLGPDIYTSFQSHLIDAMLIFASSMDQLKLYDVAPYIINTDFGSIAWTHLNISLRTAGRLPKEVVDIMVEVGRDMEARAGTYTREHGDKYMKIATEKGAKIVDVTPAEKKAWADLLATVPGEAAAKVEKESGVPMKKVMKTYIDATRELGYVWPLEYKLD